MNSRNPFKVFNRVKEHHDFMWDYVKELYMALMRPAMIFLIFAGISLMSLFGVAIYYIESTLGHNPKITSLFDSLYYSVTLMTTVGLGDLHPVTDAGKALSMLMMIIGSGLFVSFTAMISAAIIEIEQAKHRKD